MVLLMQRRTFLATTPLLAWVGGCLSPETIRRIEGEPGQEGTGLFMSRLPEVIGILATYKATDKQRLVVKERARAIHKKVAASPKGTVQQRIIAIETDPDERAVGKASVMLWDTQAEDIIGDKVYDIGSKPKTGKVVTWDTYTVQYFGAGL